MRNFFGAILLLSLLVCMYEVATRIKSSDPDSLQWLFFFVLNIECLRRIERDELDDRIKLLEATKK